MPEKLVGQVNHYYNKIGVAVVMVVKGKLAAGDTVKFRHDGKEFQQVVSSLEIGGKPVSKIGGGEEAGLKVYEPVKEGWEVFKVTG